MCITHCSKFQKLIITQITEDIYFLLRFKK